MRREKLCCMPWRRFAQVSAAVLIALVLAGAARADDIEAFIVSVTATNVSSENFPSCAAGATCSFSGTVMVDLTSGMVTGIHLTFAGLSVFDTPTTSSAGSSLFFQDAENSAGNVLELDFTTTPTPGSLIGFSGGSIEGFSIREANRSGAPRLYANFSGDIVPVPEPSSLAFLGTGLIDLCGRLRRKLKS